MNILVISIPDQYGDTPTIDALSTDLSTWYALSVKYTEEEYAKHSHPNAYGVVFSLERSIGNHRLYSVDGESSDRFGLIICTPDEYDSEVAETILELADKVSILENTLTPNVGACHFKQPDGWTSYMHSYRGGVNAFLTMLSLVSPELLESVSNE